MATSAPTLSQLFCFSSASSIGRRTPHMHLHLHCHSILFPSLPLSRSKLSIVMSVEGGGQVSNTSSSEIKTKISNTETPKPYVNNNVDPAKSYGTAKIHDFCFGIPYGGFVLSGGFLGFLFSRNPTILSTGVLYGGALLALSFLSLKIWRQGRSGIPFVLGQAVCSAALFWKNFQAYSLTKKLFPTGIYAVISAAMLCFYSYVMISGGNPPPKKLQSLTVGS